MQVREYKTFQSTEAPDGVLANKFLHGDEQAFESLYKRYRPALFKFIFNILRDYDLSCDILQQVFLQLYISLPTLKTNKPFKSWLFQVARNRCLDELRRKRVVRFSELDTYNEDDEVEMLTFVQDPCPLPEEIVERHDVRERLMSAIKSLPPRFRSVVFLRYSKQLTFPEIGKTLGMPEATAKTYFSRAKPLLRASLAS
ncbi:MAG: RNA polymerase sigma factor [Ktedonobacteraceae bacterium]